jgi:nucleotidyltransferase substrate binding protein (TIGR01987 family)
MESTKADLPRWQYRFFHYANAFKLLQEACDAYSIREFSDLEKEGLISRYAFTWELSWKLLKDYLEFLGIVLETLAPRTVIRKAAEVNIIHNAERWMRSLDLRNNLVHVYSRELRDDAIQRITVEFIGEFKQLHSVFENYNNELR